MEIEICQAPSIDWRLWSPTPWHFLEELCYTLVSLRKLAARGRDLWAVLNCEWARPETS
jgi:hypothetical protein